MATLTLGTYGNYTWYIDYSISQSVANNTSTINYTLRIKRNVSASYGAWVGDTRAFKVTIGGTSDTENHGFDFRDYSEKDFTDGSKTVTHNSDGTHSGVSVKASVSGDYVSSGFPVPQTTSTKTISLATIPRAATSISRSGSTETGAASTLSISPLVSSFYYVLEYTSPFTTAWTTIGPSGGIAGSSWPYAVTVAHSEIPNATSGTITFRVTTKDSSGGSTIGSPKTQAFIYTVPDSIVPTAGIPTWAEGATTAGLSTLTNAGEVFAQNWSRLLPTFTAAPGVGAEVDSAVVTVNGTPGNAESGTAFTDPVGVHTTQATFDVAVTDTRGRVDHETGTVSPTVHRWALPTVNAGSAVVTPTTTTQTIALSGFSATTTSFYLSGSQRNVLQTRVGYRDLTTAGAWVYGSWTSQALSASDSADNAYAPGTALTVASALDPSHEYEVTLQVRDVFGANSVNYSNGLPYVESSVLVPAQNVLVAFDGNNAVGIKKVPTQGALDVGGTIYQDKSGGSPQIVLDESDLAGIISAAITPTAVVQWTAAASAPTGWLLCDGSEVSRTTYADLFTAIGTTYGVGDGTTTFNVPDLRSRVPVGLDTRTTVNSSQQTVPLNPEFDTLGETGGEKEHTLTSSEVPPTEVTVLDTREWRSTGDRYDVGSFDASPDNYYLLVSDGGDEADPLTVKGGGGAHNNLQPYLTLNAIIKT